jgi:hypothetical protein
MLPPAVARARLAALFPEGAGLFSGGAGRLDAGAGVVGASWASTSVSRRGASDGPKRPRLSEPTAPIEAAVASAAAASHAAIARGQRIRMAPVSAGQR